MAKEVNEKTVIALLKKSPDESIAFYAKELGVPTGSIGPTIWRLEPVADPSLQFKGTKSAIVSARKNGIRWERISARTGLSVAEARRVGGPEADIYTGRGRDFTGNGGNGGAKKSASSGSGRGRGGAASGRGTSGRRGAANGDKAGAKAGASGGGGKRGARTRAEATAGRRSPS